MMINVSYPSRSAVTTLSNDLQQRKPEFLQKQSRCDALIMEARLRQSLVATRSLGSRGVRVAAMETVKSVPTFWSRWCHQAFVCPTDGRKETDLASLEQVLERTNARVLITSSAANVELIREHRKQLEKRVGIALAQDPALGIALHKERTLEIASQLGLHIPRAVTIKSESEVAAAVHEIGLPAVIKPVESWVWGKQKGVGLTSKLVTTMQEAQHAVANIAQHGIAILLQQFLSGRREAMHMFYAYGQFYARLAQWAKRTVPLLGGTSVLRQSIAIPADIGEQAERLIRAIDLEGYSEVEFRRDSVGIPYLMEINPRLSASVELAVRAGVDFPYLLYQWANGDRIVMVQEYRTGVWMRYLQGDLFTIIEAFQQRGRPGVMPPSRALLEFFSSFTTPMGYDYFDWRDPFPVLSSVANFICYMGQIQQKIDLLKRDTKTYQLCPTLLSIRKEMKHAPFKDDHSFYC
jgi:predicted ATP-grasp superfamily ATP-dependent carboligase